MFTVLGQHGGVHRRSAFAKLSQQLWRADGSMSIVRTIPPVFTDPAACSRLAEDVTPPLVKRMDSCDLKLMTSIAESAKFDLTVKSEPLERGTKPEETVKSYRQDLEPGPVGGGSGSARRYS